MDLDLDLILSGACSNPSPVKGYNLYRIDLCCVAIEVVAKPVGEWDPEAERSRFEVLSYKFVQSWE